MTIEETLSDLIPKSLDDVIRKNRDLVDLALATDEEIQTVAKDIDVHRHLKDTVSDWRIIRTKIKATGQIAMSLLGHSQEHDAPWITSLITGADMQKSYVETNSGSLYKLADRGEGEPDMYDLIHVCVAFRQWGFGDYLGVAEFFY
jgi:hypothetical protein